jgi:flagellar biosynthesis protein FlhA
MATSTNISGLNFNLVVQSLRRGEIAFALALIAVLTVLILPLPRAMLDISLAFSLTLSVLVLMTALFIEKPLEFSSFPTVLLVTTMLRLSLNVASTRLILTNGHEGPAAAGEVIRAFGHFIMGGNFVIGIIVFAILVLVNFVVITKGSGRIAEVSARFSLDAMPGKQMAIDADLSAGIINESEAKARRKELENESNFFGAMDGAAKFVRGDAIAGLCITFINIIGGIIIGIVQNNLSLAEAAHTYTLLTVGDGLVSQIPALIVSTAAGMLVSKAGSTGSADKVLFGQLGAFPSALGLSSFLMVVFSIMPGIPALPFLAIAGLTGLAAWKTMSARDRQAQEARQAEALHAAQEPTEDESIASSLHIDQIRLELSYSLLTLAHGLNGQKLTDQIKALRKQLAKELGLWLPVVRIQDNLSLPENSYVISIKEIEVGKANIKPHMLLAMNPTGEEIIIAGERTIEPTFGLKAVWINTTQRAEAESLGYTVVDPVTIMTTHLSEVIRDNISEILNYSETQKLLDGLDKAHQKLLSDMVPSQITTGGIQRILQNLLAERISIRDLPTILEAISEGCLHSHNITMITEHVRGRLARQITASHSNADGILPIVSFSPEWETVLNQSLAGDQENRLLVLPPSKLQELTSRIREVFDQQAVINESPVLLTGSSLRPSIRAIIERVRPSIFVMSQTEVFPKAKIKTVARI